MIRFSANLGFLWTDLPLPDAIREAAEAGFQAVECHWPYHESVSEIRQALTDTGLPMLGLNTLRGDVSNGDNGVSAIVGRESEARDYIEQALSLAAQIQCQNVHVMAGFTDQSAEAESTFRDNLRYASDLARQSGIGVLIEPLNHYDAPGYHLSTLDAALDTINAVGQDNIKVMFDCYHLQIMQGDLIRRLSNHIGSIGHVQIAGVPARDEPDNGELHYPNLLKAFDDAGWQGYIGAEYKPTGPTASNLHWLNAYADN